MGVAPPPGHFRQVAQNLKRNFDKDDKCNKAVYFDYPNTSTLITRTTAGTREFYDKSESAGC